MNKACQSPPYASRHADAAPGQRASASGSHRPASEATSRRYLSCGAEERERVRGGSRWAASWAAAVGLPDLRGGRRRAGRRAGSDGGGGAALRDRWPSCSADRVCLPTCTERAARSWADSRLQVGWGAGGWRAAGTRRQQQPGPPAARTLAAALIGLAHHCTAPEAGVQHRLGQLGEAGAAAVQLGALHGSGPLLRDLRAVRRKLALPDEGASARNGVDGGCNCCCPRWF